MVKRHNIAADGSWRYTNQHDSFPVTPGEVWTVGPHLFICADAERQENPWTLAGVSTETIAFVYADPPYSAGIARAYRTKAGVDGGKGAPVDYPNLIRQFVAAARLNRTVAYVESGVKTVDEVADACRSAGAEITGRWNISFYGKEPARLIAADFRPDARNDHPDFEGVDDDDTPALAVAHWARRRPNGLVLDPCAGRGLTARTAQNAGYRSVNIELSPYRLAEGIASVARIAGVNPIRVIP